MAPNNATNSSLRLHEMSYQLQGLPPALDGIRLAHISDIHVGWATSSKRIRDALRLVRESKPDLVVMTGDYICLSRWDIPAMKRALRGIADDVPVIATLGNHDFWAGPERVAAALREIGCDVLRNESRTLSLRGHDFPIVGVDDPVSEADDVGKAFSEVAEGTFVPLVLVHCGRSAPEISQRRAGLILSGHTHGGQVEIPKITDSLGKRVMGIPYMRGKHEVGTTQLYVTPGVGNSAIPFRIGQGARPEVAIHTLRSSACRLSGLPKAA